MTRKRLLVAIAFSILFGLFAVAGLIIFGAGWLEQWGNTPKKIVQSEAIIELPRGRSLEELALALKKNNLISSDLLFRLWVRKFSNYSRFQAGRYRFEQSVSPAMIAKAMQSGDVYRPVLYEIAIPEGFTIIEIAKRIEGLELGTKEEVLELSTSSKILKRYNIEATSLEGYLFPATYRLTEKLTPEEIIILLVQTFFQRLPENYQEKTSKRGLSLHQAVIFASLIEKETSQEAERSLVSEVIWNRLHKKMALAIDASIIYGIKDYDGNIRRRHLKDKSNLYNTRIHGGLPPGPIGSPGTSSLEAVLTPTSHGYYYYVVDADDFSHHRFSRTLKEHNRNVAAYVRARKTMVLKNVEPKEVNR